MSIVRQTDKQPLLILLITFVLLQLISLIPDGYAIGPYKVKRLDLFMDVRKEPDAKPSGYLHKGIMQPVEASVLPAEIIGRLFTQATRDEMNVHLSPMLPAVQKIENPGALKNFVEALKQSGSKKIRIAHYGDSAIEGDNITSDLRKNLQVKLGGNGAGLVSITPQDVQFRITTDIDWSKDKGKEWKFASLITSNPDKLPLGMNGYIFQPSAGSWVRMAASGRVPSAKYFTSVRVLYTSDKNCQIKYSFDDKSEMSAELKGIKGAGELMLSAGGKVKSVKITIVNPAKTFLYGLSLEENNGIYIDNFPLRGNSGASLRELDNNTLKEFDKIFGYKLIILNFGLNMIGPDAKDYGWYEASMEKVINQYKEAFPQASFLMVSVQDRSSKKGSNFVTDPTVPKLVEAQKHIAHKTGIAFWNLFEAMGGMNSMSSWVDNGFAERDYTHLKLQGAKKVADMLTEALLSVQ